LRVRLNARGTGSTRGGKRLDFGLVVPSVFVRAYRLRPIFPATILPFSHPTRKGYKGDSMAAVSILSFLKSNWLLVVILTAVLAFVGVHLVWYIRPSDVKSIEDLNARVTSGQPVIVEFYSNL
jgi:hypothetical protein